MSVLFFVFNSAAAKIGLSKWNLMNEKFGGLTLRIVGVSTQPLIELSH